MAVRTQRLDADQSYIGWKMAQTGRHLDVAFADLAALDPCCVLQLQELERIGNELDKFLAPRDARETAGRILDVVLAVDEELERMLADPLVQRLYEYDGQFFTPKHGWGFHRAFDGVHILQWLTDEILETFFGARQKELAIQWLMDELAKHTWEAKIRRMNWEEYKTLGLLPKAVLDELVRNVRQQSETALERKIPLSREEQSFFRFFEEQMR